MGSETFGGRGASLLATLDRLDRIATGADVKVIGERAAAAIREEFGLPTWRSRSTTRRPGWCGTWPSRRP